MALSPTSTATMVTANFPHPVLTPFASDLQPPTHASLQTLQRELNANAMSVHSYQGGGLHGHLTLTMQPAAYLAISNVAFPAPAVPPLTPTIPAGAVQALIGEVVRQHTEDVRAFRLYHDTDKALVRAILAATPGTYVVSLSDPDFGYANVTTLEVLTHLHSTYGTLTPADRDANLARMTTPWTPPTPIEALFHQLETGQRFAGLAQEPIAETQLARMGYQLVLKTGMFPDGCREWRLKPVTDQTWAAFKTHFARQDQDRHETATSASAGYTGSAYHVQPVLSGSVPPPSSPGTALAATVLPSGPELIALLAELAQLRANAPTPVTKNTSTATRGYCWTHGSTANSAHTSATCKNKLPGHVDTATWRNKQGGNAGTYVPPSRRPKTPMA